jgi:two-component system KDP operon response regulator KdpE
MMRRPRIVVSDDDLSVVKIVKANLEAEGYDVLTAMNGAQALQIIEMEPPDLVILDIMMPDIDGLEVCRRLREWTKIPIIMLSAKSNEADKVKCLDLGADDYITKPFGSKELKARVRALLRRAEATAVKPDQPSFSKDFLKVDFTRRQVSIAGDRVNLTPTEYTLLREFVLNTGRVLTYSYLLNKVWGPEYRDEREYLYVFVNRLRAKLEPDPVKPRYIMTVPGVGYQFQDSQ